MSEATAKRHMGLKTSRAITNTAIHILLIAISIIWLIPFICIVLQSFRVENTGPVGYVLPKVWGTGNYTKLFQTDFVRWYTNTFIAALVTAVLQTVIVLCMSYTLSRFRFKMRQPLMRFMLILSMFPGMLSMIIRRVVDLPQPEGPTKTTNSLSLISRLKSWTAVDRHLHHPDRLHGTLGRLRLCALHRLRNVGRQECGRRSV